ncbi:hypothetical protein, conserved [Leishmania tarentolae]|uniref:Uncharacterized protein n=1 Tax=Leishmania tarentolae TaxID=5689 RepID=A0A640KR37_LEITA|nr:hypothetical protein, conserved [Leishmania tarentolae]
MHACRVLESRRRSGRAPGLGGMVAAMRGFSSTAPLYSPVLNVFRKDKTPDTASSAIADAPPASQSSFRSTHSEHHRHQPSFERRHLCTPQSISASASTEPYLFPVGRALRYVQLGRRYHDETEGQKKLHEWLAEVSFSPCVETEGQCLGNWGENAKGSSTSKSDVHGPELVAEVSSFAKYHAHHALIEFKALRRRIAEADPCTQVLRVGSQKPTYSSLLSRHRHGTEGNAEEFLTSSSTSSSPHPLPAHFTVALTQSLFNATVLLHVSGLFGVADTHVERLLQVCFSASIFLAQDSATGAAAARRQRGKRCASSSSSEAPRRGGATAAVAETPPRSQHLHSLHWAIVHFAAGVQHWGLLEHTSPLQDVLGTQRPYERLLQAHAALLCEQTRRCVDHMLWHELVLLKAGRRAKEARDAWFMGPDAAMYSMLFSAKPNSSSCGSATAADSLAICVPPRLQQRRLQLLPMLWLSFLCSQLQKSDTSAEQALPTCAAARISPSSPDKAEVTWASARHAFTSLLPLFSKDARMDVTAWATLHLLFLPRRQNHQFKEKGMPAKMPQTGSFSSAAATTNATLPELCALLARVERDGAMLELGAALPGPASTHAESSVCFHLASFLRRWLDETATSPCVLSSHGTSHVGFTGRNRRMRRGDSALTTLQAPVQTEGQLYRALLNIPLSALFLPSTKSSSSDNLCSASALAEHAFTGPSLGQPLSVTVGGVLLLNSLLLRVLLQWRSDRRAWGVRQSSGGGPPRPVSEKLPSAGGAAPIMPECSWPASKPCSESTDPGCHGKLTEAGQAESHPGLFPASQPVSTNHMMVSAAERRRQWERELVYVLKASLHLGALIKEGADDGVSGGRDSVRGAGLIRALVTPTAQAVARALAEQLGRSLLPWRLLLLHCEHVSLTEAELQLLCKLDATLRRVLLLYSPQGVRRSDAETATPPTEVGSLPILYRVSMNALICTAA